MPDGVMLMWWSRQITRSQQAAWCSALAGSTVTEAMVATVPEQMRDGRPSSWLSWSAPTSAGIPDGGWLLSADFQAFVADRCAHRFR
jgi:hypothetical protein